MGRHIIGYEVQKVRSVVDWFKQRSGARVGAAGYGEGGLIAFYAAAVDPRIEVCLASGFFGPQERIWEEPIYRNLFGLMREFGPAEIATLIAPRGLVIEYSMVPDVNGPPPASPGRKGAAPGGLRTFPFTAVQAEFDRVESLLRPGFQPRYLVGGPDGMPAGPGSPRAVERFARLLGRAPAMPLSARAPVDRRKSFDPGRRQMLHVPLEVPLRALPLRRRGQGHDPRGTGIEVLGHPFDRAALSCRVPSLEGHYEPGAFRPYPLLQLHQLRLQPVQLPLVHLAVQPLLGLRTHPHHPSSDTLGHEHDSRPGTCPIEKKSNQ